MTQTAAKPLFDLGRILITPGAIDALRDAQTEFTALLQRTSPVIGAICARTINTKTSLALRTDAESSSAYRMATGAKLWIMTEGDHRTLAKRILTTNSRLLLPGRTP